MMELASKKNIKVVALAVCAAMVVGIFVMAVQGKNLGTGDDTLNSAIGKINYNQVISVVPGIEEAQTKMQQEVEANKKEYEEKSKNMSDADKQKLSQEYRTKLENKQKELLDPLKKKVDDAVLQVGKTKGLSVIVNQGAVVYGGVDVTADVQAELKKAAK